MKLQMTESNDCFTIDLEAETVAEAALLVRFSLNRTKSILSASTDAYWNNIGANITIGKIARPTTTVTR